MSALASGVGGYLAGRLRSKWVDVDGDEAFFRDTAHGLLAWAVATVLTASVLTTAASSMVGTAAKVTAGAATTIGAAGAGGAAAGIANNAGANTSSSPEVSRSYFVDMMFRTAKPVDPGTDIQQRPGAAAAHGPMI